MMNLKDLAVAIKLNPENIKDLLASFRTTSEEVRKFVLTLNSIPSYIVPDMIYFFANKHIENEPRTIHELMSQGKYLDCMFTLTEDGTDWTYLGVSPNGKALCRPINSHLVLEINTEKGIKYAF